MYLQNDKRGCAVLPGWLHAGWLVCVIMPEESRRCMTLPNFSADFMNRTVVLARRCTARHIGPRHNFNFQNMSVDRFYLRRKSCRREMS